MLKNNNYNDAVSVIKKISHNIKTEDFELVKNSYIRYIISNTDDYWLSILKWDKGVKTSIHGHPQQSFLYVLDGEFTINNYKSDTSLISSKISKTGYYYHCNGKVNRLDNCIHRMESNIECLSLHFYSDDPRKGIVFSS